jgi:glycosyltransferase involved in cell wall biosynthesis
MNILHVISSMSQEAGGPPGVCAGLARALTARGHAVAIATIDEPGRSRLPLPDAIPVHAFPADNPGGYASSKSLAAWLARETKRFDLVHLHAVWQFPTYAAARAAYAARVPYVVMPHGMLDTYSVTHRSAWKKKLYWLLRERRVAARAAALHCLNRAEIRRAVPWVRRFPKFVVPNGIAQAELDGLPARGAFRAAHPEIGDRPVALFLSRLHPKKGLDRLIPAWTDVAAKMPDACLVIAGTGDADYVAALDRLIASNNLTGQVLRVGQLQGRDKWQALVDADVFVLPSHQEGFSMAITEALGAGRPCVITEECNFDEVRDAACGVVIPDGDMPAFTRATIDLLADAPTRHGIGETARTLVRTRFTWEKIAAGLEQVYTWILARKPLPPTGEDTWRP